MIKGTFFFGVFLSQVVGARSVEACAVCFGPSPDTKQYIAITFAILVLLGLLSGIMVGIITFFVRLHKRSNHKTTMVNYSI